MLRDWIPVIVSSQKSTTFMKPQHPQGISTSSVHGGEPRLRASKSVTEPIVHGVMFPFANTQEMVDFLETRKYAGTVDRDDYGRNGNPTRRAAEAKLAALENRSGQADLDAILTASGMAALSGLLLYTLGQGDHLILSDSLYRVSLQFALNLLTRYGVEVTTVSPMGLDPVREALQPNTKLILVESPSNPFNYCSDLNELARMGRENDIVTVVDSTFATPFNLQPLDFGIDFVVHSVTKYLSGHNDVMAGAIIADSWAITGLRTIQTQLGAILDPASASAIMRGLKTFGLRMERHNANAMALASLLERHPKVKRVWYPGLESHPNHEIAQSQMLGYGGVVSFEVADHEAAARLNDSLNVGLLGGSLGATETLIHQPWLLSHYDQSPAERADLGIADGLIRVACGIEDTEDLLDDFSQGLRQL